MSPKDPRSIAANLTKDSPCPPPIADRYWWRKSGEPTVPETVFARALAAVGVDEEDAAELYGECLNKLFAAEPTVAGLAMMTFDEWRLVLSPAVARAAAQIREEAIVRQASAQAKQDMAARERLLERAKNLSVMGLDGAAKRVVEQATKGL